MIHTSIGKTSRPWLPKGLACVLASLLTGCSPNGDVADAYGTFEAVEVTVSAEAAGRLVSFDVEEGNVLPAGMAVGLVDTTQLSLRMSQMMASRRAVRSKIRSLRAQVEVLEERRRVVAREAQRIERLFADGAATRKQLDDITGEASVLDRQIEQTRSQDATIRAEADALSAQVAQVRDQIDRSVIVNPVTGTVLTAFVEPHELVSHGRALYEIANLDTMELRAYLSGVQLPLARIGQQVEVQIDEDRDANRSIPGKITWIAGVAEFTPKFIQTKEERVDLVYAFKVQVPNGDGSIKIGMPGEVWFGNE